MKLWEILNKPTVIDNVHESVYRSHAVLLKAREMLGQGTPASAVVSFIDDMLDAPELEVERARTGDFTPLDRNGIRNGDQ